jgi:DNA-binding HxlR family transcriptional regulator
MKAKSFADMACSIAGAMEAIGDRWSILIIRDLSIGLSRYDQLQTSTGMPPTTLADRLRHLEATGIIAKRPYSTHPPRHDYVLTAKGRDLWVVTLALAQWGDRWNASGRGAPPVEFFDGRSGHPVRLASVDATTGTPVPSHQIRLRPGPGADDLARWRIAEAAKRPE